MLLLLLLGIIEAVPGIVAVMVAVTAVIQTRARVQAPGTPAVKSNKLSKLHLLLVLERPFAAVMNQVDGPARRENVY